MIPLSFNYTGPSRVTSDRDRTRLGLSADARRPVRFTARVVRHVLSLRLALQTFGTVLWSSDIWFRAGGVPMPEVAFDPLVTVHPDRLFFEAFSRDQSAYALLVADRQLFEPEDDVLCGTTNCYFDAWLSSALNDLRSSREAWLCIGSDQGTSDTIDEVGHLERRVEVPDEWVRGFLQLQEAMALPGTRVTARPVDLLAAIRFLQLNRSNAAPRALRYEFEPDQPARLVLEPWEQVIPLKGTEHNYQEKRVIRTWGRRRLQLLEPLLPYAERVDVYLKGRARPSFYAVRLPGVTFLLGLTGWTDQTWTGAGGADNLGDEGASLLSAALDHLRDAVTLRPESLAESLGVGKDVAVRLLTRLCRQGRVHYDIENFTFRNREVFAEPVDESRVFPPSPQQERARKLLQEGTVRIEECGPRETCKVRKYRSPRGGVTEKTVV
ncbi:MAG TPA: hypothetical protein VKD72_05525, partial [Gemmataceae bacterium]|nr:hypothetical protein [Gemmataceae bacterium]